MYRKLRPHIVLCFYVLGSRRQIPCHQVEVSRKAELPPMPVRVWHAKTHVYLHVLSLSTSMRLLSAMACLFHHVPVPSHLIGKGKRDILPKLVTRRRHCLSVEPRAVACLLSTDVLVGEGVGEVGRTMKDKRRKCHHRQREAGVGSQS